MRPDPAATRPDPRPWLDRAMEQWHALWDMTLEQRCGLAPYTPKATAR